MKAVECPMCHSDQVRLIDINCAVTVAKCEWCGNIWRHRDEKASVS
jgi:transcription elongation factor Elf1